MSFRVVERFFGSSFRDIVLMLSTIPTNKLIERNFNRFLQETRLETREGQDRRDGREDGDTLSIDSREALELTEGSKGEEIQEEGVTPRNIDC